VEPSTDYVLGETKPSWISRSLGRSRCSASTTIPTATWPSGIAKSTPPGHHHQPFGWRILVDSWHGRLRAEVEKDSLRTSAGSSRCHSCAGKCGASIASTFDPVGRCSDRRQRQQPRCEPDLDSRQVAAELSTCPTNKLLVVGLQLLPSTPRPISFSLYSQRPRAIDLPTDTHVGVSRFRSATSRLDAGGYNTSGMLECISAQDARRGRPVRGSIAPSLSKRTGSTIPTMNATSPFETTGPTCFAWA
jgi:hypothetical protein